VPAIKLWIPNGLWAIHGGYEFPLMWLLMQLTLAMLGPGPCSLKVLAGTGR
jgi:putative oxidoreductase